MFYSPAAKTSAVPRFQRELPNQKQPAYDRWDGEKESYMKRDVYQIITDRIIGLLESGTVPWRRPWKGGSEAPQNFISRKAYRGINCFLLHAAGFASPFWLTFKQVTDPIQFGSNPYSRKELVAEMGAAFLCGHCEIENTTLLQSASYIQHWLERLKDDRKLVVHAAAQAQKACDFVLGVKHQMEGGQNVPA